MKPTIIYDEAFVQALHDGSVDKAATEGVFDGLMKLSSQHTLKLGLIPFIGHEISRVTGTDQRTGLALAAIAFYHGLAAAVQAPVSYLPKEIIEVSALKSILGVNVNGYEEHLTMLTKANPGPMADALLDSMQKRTKANTKGNSTTN